jgi:hypothetical protein
MCWLGLPVLSEAGITVYMSLGSLYEQATHIAVAEVASVDRDKKIIKFKILEPVKGRFPESEFVQSYEKGGLLPLERELLASWVERGKKVVWMHNDAVTVTFTGTFWYVAVPGKDSKITSSAFTHMDFPLSTTYHGNPESMAKALAKLGKGEEVAVTFLKDQNLFPVSRIRQGTVIRAKARLKQGEYARKDWIGIGSDGEKIPMVIRHPLLKPLDEHGKYLSLTKDDCMPIDWNTPKFDDSIWKKGKARIGYGEGEVRKQIATLVDGSTTRILYRRSFEVFKELVGPEGEPFVSMRILLTGAGEIFLNEKSIFRVEQKDAADQLLEKHVAISPALFRTGSNILAMRIEPAPMKRNLVLDCELVLDRVEWKIVPNEELPKKN